MSRKKIDRETIEAAVKDAFDKMPEETLIDTAIEKRVRLRGVPKRARIQRSSSITCSGWDSTTT
jgi:hypothetical protein